MYILSYDIRTKDETMNLDLDPASPVPLYIQIVEQVRRQIALGALRPGDRLPTVRDLAVQVRVNRNTAARAIQELERNGLVRTRVGQGTFVQEQALEVERGVLEEKMDQAIDRLLVEAGTMGMAIDVLAERFAARIDLFKKNEGGGHE